MIYLRVIFNTLVTSLSIMAKRVDRTQAPPSRCLTFVDIVTRSFIRSQSLTNSSKEVLKGLNIFFLCSVFSKVFYVTCKKAKMRSESINSIK